MTNNVEFITYILVNIQLLKHVIHFHKNIQIMRLKFTSAFVLSFMLKNAVAMETWPFQFYAEIRI
jgi:hypothetical protein